MLSHSEIQPKRTFILRDWLAIETQQDNFKFVALMTRYELCDLCIPLKCFVIITVLQKRMYLHCFVLASTQGKCS
jgi:hypothetical protein